MKGSKFGEHLLSEGKLNRAGLKKALEIQHLAGNRLGTNLLELGLIGEDDLIEALGKFRGTRIASAHDLKNIPPEVIRLVPPKMARRYQVLPIERKGNTVILASTDPGDALVEDEIGILNSCLARTVIALELRIHGALERYYKIPQPTRFSGLARQLEGRAAAAKARPAPVEEPPEKAPAPPPSPAVKPAETVKPAQTVKPAPPKPEEPPEVRFVEIDAEELKKIYEGAKPVSESELELPVSTTLLGPPDPVAALAKLEGESPEERLHAAAVALQHSDIRDEIGDVLLTYCAPYFKRRALFIRRKDEIVGWRGEGDGVATETVRTLVTAVDEPSVFTGLNDAGSFWLAPLPPLPANRRLVRGLGEKAPKGSLVLPVILRSRVVCYLYGDNGEDGVAGAPMSALRRLAAKAGLAFEVYILKNKIRTL